MCSKSYGNKGRLSIEGDNVKLANASGIKTLEVPEDLVNPAAQVGNNFPLSSSHLSYCRLSTQEESRMGIIIPRPEL